MGVYNEPKTFSELSEWHANRMPFKYERLGQAYSNDFSLTDERLYYEEGPQIAWELLTCMLSDKNEDFWGEFQ